MEIYRLFAAIRPPSKIINQLTRLQKGVAGARWSGPEKLHVTLGFFGDVDSERAEVLDEKLAEIRRTSFELSLSEVGHFGRSEPHAIWAGVDETDSLLAMHRNVKRAARAADVIMEKRDYRPHVTLAYMKAMPDVESVARWEKRYSGFKTGPFLVDEFFLYSSTRRKTGSNIYQAEASYPLLG